MSRNKNKLQNSLTITRKRLGLGQKQVAHLLKHKTTDQVSRYEKGYRIPGLKILLQFEIIYGIPARVVYGEFFEKLRLEIQDRAKITSTLANTKALVDSENQLSTPETKFAGIFLSAIFFSQPSHHEKGKCGKGK